MKDTIKWGGKIYAVIGANGNGDGTITLKVKSIKPQPKKIKS